MAGPHQPFGLPDSDLPHQKYMYVCMYVCMYVTDCTEFYNQNRSQSRNEINTCTHGTLSSNTQ